MPKGKVTGAGPAGCPGEGLAAAVADLSCLDEARRLQALAALTARFAATYLRALGNRGPASYPRVRVLDALEQAGPTMMRDLADSLGMTARNITAIVDALEGAGLVVRRPHPDDRRATLVELTDAGRSSTCGARDLALGKVAAAFLALPPEDQQRYADIVATLTAAFND